VINGITTIKKIHYVDYTVWGHCSRWHGHKISESDQLKCVLIECRV